MKVDLEGRKVGDSPHEINPAGFTIHSAIHAAREDADCVLHVHSVNGVAVSAQEQGLLPLSQHSMFVLSSLAYHDYEGVALNDDEKPRLVRDLGDKRFLMLRNHGLLTVGRTVAEAFVAHVLLRDQLHDPGARRRRPAAAPHRRRSARRIGEIVGDGHARRGRGARLAGAAAPPGPREPRLPRLNAACQPGCVGSIQGTFSGGSAGSMSRLIATASPSLRTSTHSSVSVGLALISWCGTKGGT